MKKIYESPESLTVIIQMHGQLLDVMSPGGDDEPPGAREHNSHIWDDGVENNDKVSDEEW
jgi:hypothetical protein